MADIAEDKKKKDIAADEGIYGRKTLLSEPVDAIASAGTNAFKGLTSALPTITTSLGNAYSKTLGNNGIAGSGAPTYAADPYSIKDSTPVAATPPQTQQNTGIAAPVSPSSLVATRPDTAAMDWTKAGKDAMTAVKGFGINTQTGQQAGGSNYADYTRNGDGTLSPKPQTGQGIGDYGVSAEKARYAEYLKQEAIDQQRGRDQDIQKQRQGIMTGMQDIMKQLGSSALVPNEYERSFVGEAKMSNPSYKNMLATTGMMTDKRDALMQQLGILSAQAGMTHNDQTDMSGRIKEQMDTGERRYATDATMKHNQNTADHQNKQLVIEQQNADSNKVYREARAKLADAGIDPETGMVVQKHSEKTKDDKFKNALSIIKEYREGGGKRSGITAYQLKAAQDTVSAQMGASEGKAIPGGMTKQVGTSGGKPVYEDANGKRFIGA